MNAEFLCFIEFAAWLGAGEDVIGFLAHAAGDVPAERFDFFGCFFARLNEGSVPVRTKVLPANGNSAAFFAETFSLFGLIPSSFIRRRTFCPAEDSKKSSTLCATTGPTSVTMPRSLSALLFEGLAKPDLISRSAISPRFVLFFVVIFENVAEQLRIGDVLDRFVKTGELRCGGFSHIGNGKSEKPSRQRQSSGALDCVNRFGRVFLAENTRRFLSAEIQFGELLDL